MDIGKVDPFKELVVPQGFEIVVAAIYPSTKSLLRDS